MGMSANQPKVLAAGRLKKKISLLFPLKLQSYPLQTDKKQ